MSGDQLAYGIGADLGTSITAAAVSDLTGTRTVRLGRDIAVPSAVFAAADGTLVTGDSALEQGPIRPDHLSQAHKRRLGDPAPLTLGGIARSPASLHAFVQSHLGVVTAAAVRLPPRPEAVRVMWL